VNTRIEYLYRDAKDFRFYGEVVLPGSPRRGLQRMEADLRKASDADGRFVARQVGLLDLFPWVTGHGSYGRNDHCYHEIASVSLTYSESTDARSPEELIAAFKAIGPDGWCWFDPQSEVRMESETPVEALAQTL